MENEKNKKYVNMKSFLTFVVLGVFALGSSLYVSQKMQDNDIDSIISSAKDSIESYQTCMSINSCKKENRDDLKNSLDKLGDFYLNAKKYQVADIEKANKFSKEAVIRLIDLSEPDRALLLTLAAIEHITKEDYKTLMKVFYEKKSQLTKHVIFDVAGLLYRDGFYLESTKLFMSNPELITEFSSHAILTTLSSLNCSDDFLIWADFYSKLSPEKSIKNPVNKSVADEYLGLIKKVDGSELSRINNISSEMINSKKYPDISDKCEIKNFTIYK